MDSRLTVCQGLPRQFKHELIKSCQDILRNAGVLPNKERFDASSRTDRRHDPREEQESEEFDHKTRVRTLGTCRFMGELFMQERFKMLKIVQRIVNTFIQTHDALSVECLCVLLSRVGKRFENINGDAAAPCPPNQVYEKLGRYLATGCVGNNPLPRRTLQIIDTLLRARELCRAGLYRDWSQHAGPNQQRLWRTANDRGTPTAADYRGYRNHSVRPLWYRENPNRQVTFAQQYSFRTNAGADGLSIRSSDRSYGISGRRPDRRQTQRQ
uniref:Eukaryotic translation initiation factor 4 gamma 3 n=1 Tax=Sipha flava TaxID=143950 RepID=A0A2S2R2D3_9HEMI